MAHIKDRDLLYEFNRRMRTLKEDGVFTSQKRSVTGDGRYLIISYGGTGAEALFQIRRTLKKTLPADQFKNYIRFLAIDTDQKTMNQTELVDKGDGTQETVVKDALEPEEFCWLNGTAARAALSPMSKDVEAWINPDLPGLIDSDPTFLDGNGASGTRQIGRLTLFPATVCTRLRKMVSDHVRALVKENKDPLYIMIVSGISGGTGSGTVVDATYLIRDAAEGVVAGLADRTKVSGFIMLPTTGDAGADAPIIEKGNRNGYAALKEINHFMTLASRKDVYRQVYGSLVVRSEKNIFDSCYLMDGIPMGVLKDNPREFVKNVLADCIVDMISSQPTAADGGAAPRAIESLMSDVKTFTTSMLANKRREHAPRDADYLYCVLGHGSVDIPVDEIKTYVARQIFAKMYKSYQDGADVDKKDVKDFVKTVNRSGENWKSVTNKELNGYFTDSEYGPYFVINLLYEAIPMVEEMKGRLGANKDRLEDIRRYFLALNNTYFAVFTEVLESLKGILDEQYGMVCEGTYSMNGRNTCYSFRPISMKSGDKASAVIRTYLSELVTNSRVQKLSEELLETIIANRDIWARLDKNATANGPAFDAPAQIRIFWEREITKIVHATIEDLLIKLYSNDKNAKYVKDDPESEAKLKLAAETIFQEMFGDTGYSLPTATLHVDIGLTMADFNGNNYMMVPQEAPHLLAAIREVAGRSEPHVQIYSSTATDCISCYSQYTSIPAFKFDWVRTGEPHYEGQIGSKGLHMAETSGTNDWRELPNLMPRSTWHLINGYHNPREALLADRAQEMFDDAKKLSLTKAQPAIGAPLLQYSLRRLNDSLLPDAQLFKEFDIRNVPVADEDTVRDRKLFEAKIKAQAKAAAEKLFASVDSWLGVENIVEKLEEVAPDTFLIKELRTVDAVLDVPERPEGWSETIAACYLRKMPDLMAYMRGTLMVMHDLEEMVRAAQSEVDQIVDFAKFAVADLFYFDEDYQEWKYTDGSREYVLFAQEIDDEVQEVSAFYFMFEAYKEKSEDVRDALLPEFEELSGVGEDRPVQVEKRRALNAKAKALYQANQKKLTIDRKNPDKMSQLGSAEFARACKDKGYDAEAIQALYQKLNDTIRASFNIR